MRVIAGLVIAMSASVACAGGRRGGPPELVSGRVTAAGVDSTEHVVRAFVGAFNVQDLPALLALADSSIAWISVLGDSVAIETRGRAALEASLAAYFRRLPSARSTLEALTVSGPWVTVRERAYWEGSAGPRTQAAVAVYEIRDGRVRRVWYFPVIP